jgi:hypothetical protein
MRKGDAVAAIREEIKWCQQHLSPNSGRTPSAEQKVGFIEGLRQALRLIQRIPAGKP